jgi:hypothetical protein
LHLARASDVQVLADDLLEEDAPRHGSIEDLGQRELGLQDRQRVAVAGGPIVPIERMRQSCQPLTQQPIYLGPIEPIADSLQRLGVLAGKNAVVQRLEGDAALSV